MRDITNISIDPKNSQIIYSVGVSGNSNLNCFAKSQDGGASWQPLSFPHITPTDSFGTLAISSSNPKLFLASSDLLYRSVNAGQSWITITNGKGNLFASVAINSKTIPDVYAFAYNRLFASFANSKWRLLKTPPSFGISRLLVSTKDPLRLIAGGSHIPFTSTAKEALIVSFNGGNTWQYRTAFESVQELIMDPQDPNKLYAGGNLFFGSGLKVAIGRSTDFGKTWETVVTNAYASYANIRIDPMNPSLLYASSADGILRSTNSGKSWNLYGTLPPSKMIFSMDVTTQHLFAVMEDPDGEVFHSLYRSDDGGLSFQPKNAGLNALSLYFVKVHPTIASTVFVGSEKGLFISTNEGESWELFKTAGLPQHPDIYNIAIPLANPNEYFVGTGQGVFSFTNK